MTIEPIYQVLQMLNTGGWKDTTKEHYDATLTDRRRIVYVDAEDAIRERVKNAEIDENGFVHWKKSE